MPSAAEFAHSKCLSVGEAALYGKRAQRVAPFPNLPRKDNNGENKATVYAKLYLNRESLCRRFAALNCFRSLCVQASFHPLTYSQFWVLSRDERT